MKASSLTTVVFRFVDRWLPIRRSLPVGLWSVKWRAIGVPFAVHLLFMGLFPIFGAEFI